MYVGEHVIIYMSEALAELRLKPLIGQHGLIKEMHGSGCWIAFERPYLGEREWFVPNASIVEA